MSLVRIRKLVPALVLTAVAAAAATTGYAYASGTPEGGAAAAATIIDAGGQEVGKLSMRSTEHGKVEVSVRVSGLDAGVHGFHVHETGTCDPKAVDPDTGKPAPFATAGGHHNPTDASHGDHDGDLPSLLVTEDGAAAGSFATDRFTIDELLDQDGSAVMIHAGRDNFANIPERYTTNGKPGPDADTLATGDAGARAACGVIERA